MNELLNVGPAVFAVMAAALLAGALYLNWRKRTEGAAAAAAADAGNEDERQAHEAAARRHGNNAMACLAGGILVTLITAALWLGGQIVSLIPEGVGGEPGAQAQVGTPTPTAALAQAAATPTHLAPQPTKTPEPPPAITRKAPAGTMNTGQACSERPGKLTVQFESVPGCFYYDFDPGGNQGTDLIATSHWDQDVVSGEGQILDESLPPGGDFILGVLWAMDNQDVQEVETGGVVLYGVGSPNQGVRYRFWGLDGQAWRFGAEASLEKYLRDAVVTAVDINGWHRDNPASLPFVKLVRFGDDIIPHEPFWDADECPNKAGMIGVKFSRYPDKGCVYYSFDGSGNQGTVDFEQPLWDEFLEQSGELVDQNPKAGEFLIVESWSFHNQDQQINDGCVVGYGPGPNRYRLTVWDGRGFVFAPTVSLAQRVKASIKTQIDAHNCYEGYPEDLPVVRLEPFNEPGN